MLLKTEKAVRVKIRGRTVEMVREQYIRNDVPCFANQCPICDNKSVNGCLLPADLTHYLVPFPDVALKYLEILEFPEIRGIIFAQTVVQKVYHEGGKRLYQKLCELVRDCRKGSVMFANEFCEQVYSPRNVEESLLEWQSRIVYSVGVWYYNHLQKCFPVVMITENTKIIERFDDCNEGIFIMTLNDYLKQFWPNLETAFNIYESLTALLSIEQTNESSTEYTEHLPIDVLEAGIKMGHYHKGIIRVNKHYAQMEAFVSTESISNVACEKEVLISGSKYRNRAIHGDVVVIEILPISEWQGRIRSLGNQEERTLKTSDCGDRLSGERLPTAKVVGILQRNWRDYVVSLPQDEVFGKSGSSDRILSIPYDYRIPKIRIFTRQAASLEGQRVVVRIDSWEVNSQYPNGHFVRSLGKIGEIEAETMTILVEKEIPISSFPPGVLKEMPVDTVDNPWVMDPNEIAARKDLRQSHLICSIDPIGCEDVDDALSIRCLENGQIELGVHIADVTHFVKPNSYTDRDARARGSTVYLADRRYDMLPSIISSNLCSLNSNVDRFAVSVFWVLDKQYHVVDVWYGRTVICSSFKLFYEIAQEIIDGNDIDGVRSSISELQHLDLKNAAKKFQELKRSIMLLTEVAHVLKARRIMAGALELDSAEIQLEFRDDRGGMVDIDDIKPKISLDIHSTVAECMIFANYWVAKKIRNEFPTQALLRRHPPPRQDKLQNVVLLAESQGFSLDTSSNKTLAASLDRCVNPNNPYINKLLRSVTVQAMNIAQYFSSGTVSCDDYYHYGLALSDYTHFTSPIRRYADVLVHRLLLAAVTLQNDNLLGCQALQDVCDHINIEHRAAQNAQRASQELFQFIFFGSFCEDDERRNALAIIFGIRSNGVLVYLPRYGLKGPLYLRNKQQQVIRIDDRKAEWVTGSLDQEKFQINVVTGFGVQSFRLFDQIMVRISVEKSHAHSPSVTLELADNHVASKSCIEIRNSEFLSRKDLIKEVSELQGRLSESDEIDSESNAIRDRDTSVAVTSTSPFYLLIEDLRRLALRQTS